MSVSPTPAARHVAVLPTEVLHFLAPALGETIVDATVGVGGHARLIAQRPGPRDGSSAWIATRPCWPWLGRHCLISRSPWSRPISPSSRGADRAGNCGRRWYSGRFGLLLRSGRNAGAGLQLQPVGTPGHAHGPGPGRTGQQLAAALSERDLADLIFHYGEERFSRRIARRIVELRRTQPLETTEQLADLVRRCRRAPREPEDGASTRRPAFSRRCGSPSMTNWRPWIGWWSSCPGASSRADGRC